MSRTGEPQLYREDGRRVEERRYPVMTDDNKTKIFMYIMIVTSI